MSNQLRFHYFTRVRKVDGAIEETQIVLNWRHVVYAEPVDSDFGDITRVHLVGGKDLYVRGTVDRVSFTLDDIPWIKPDLSGAEE